MEGINIESRRTIYFGINYVIAYDWRPEKRKLLAFEQSLVEEKLDFADRRIEGRTFALRRKEQSPLEVRLASVGTSVSNIIVRSQRPTYELSLFVKEAEVVYDAYRDTWFKDEACQIVRSDATIRHLYSCGEHAFKYLWEKRLNQEEDDFRLLGGRPVLGGGLRLVMPPIEGMDKEPTNIEVKIESFLREPGQMFIETAFVWPQPRLLGADEKFDVDDRLNLVEKYAISEVCEFLLKHSQEE